MCLAAKWTVCLPAPKRDCICPIVMPRASGPGDAPTWPLARDGRVGGAVLSGDKTELGADQLGEQQFSDVQVGNAAQYGDKPVAGIDSLGEQAGVRAVDAEQ